MDLSLSLYTQADGCVWLVNDMHNNLNTTHFTAKSFCAFDFSVLINNYRSIRIDFQADKSLGRQITHPNTNFAGITPVVLCPAHS